MRRLRRLDCDVILVLFGTASWPRGKVPGVDLLLDVTSCSYILLFVEKKKDGARIKIGHVQFENKYIKSPTTFFLEIQA